MLIGFISPEGDFYECASWEHTSKATTLCEKLYNKEFYIRQDAEDYLLSLGYLVLRARDAYMSYLNGDKWIVLSDKQIAWLTDKADNFNDGQKKDLNDILHDQEDIRKRHKT